MRINRDFLGGGGRGVQNKKRSVGGVWIFSGTAQRKKKKKQKEKEKIDRVVNFLSHFQFLYTCL